MGHLHSDSRAFEALPFSIPEGAPEEAQTTPGELLAAAYSAFVATHLAQRLERDGVPAQELVVDVWRLRSARVDSAGALDRLEVAVRGRVNRIDTADFEEAARAAWDTCAHSLGLSDDLRVELRVKLAG